MTKTPSFLAIVGVLWLLGETTSTPPACTEPIYNCFVDPCVTATCPGRPVATCVANYCGGCNADFFEGGTNVTAQCFLPPPPQLVCPAPAGGGFGSCLHQCADDSECSNDYLCCSNGCGTSCMQGVPATTPPTTPPTTTTAPNCAAVLCLRPVCGDGVVPITPPGQCCPQCPPTRPPCTLVRCAYPLCRNGTPFTPSGQCCPQCPSAFCFAPVNTPAASRNCVTRWSYDRVRGCIEIQYCGEEEEGQNVFLTSEACEVSCGPPQTTMPPVTTPTPVTETPVRPVPQRAAVCPTVQPSPSGSCPQTCSSNQDCTDDQMCCSNACGGQSCVTPDLVPYYTPPQVCPAPTNTCTTRRPSCTDDSSCAANQLCCPNSNCGSFCMDAVESSQPCSTVRDVLIAVGHPPGAYVPACQENGKFSPAQFHGSTGYSWCVNVETGQPVSGYYPRGSTPQCPNCTVAGRNYSVGESYPASDGCNICSCLAGGRSICTLRPCPPPSPCSLPPESGLCLAAFLKYYYDQRTGSCRHFTYGGCGGNANRFSTVRECLLACAPEDRCLMRPEVGPCDALFPSFFFNSSSGVCERFTYGGCGGNDNRFSTASDCLQACSPDSVRPTTPPLPQETTASVIPPVTETPVRPVPQRAAVCLTVQPSPSGSCPQTCSSNQDCTDDQMCCSDACGGQSCVTPDLVPYYTPPQVCPAPTNTCTTRRPSCTDDSSCAANQLCCPNSNCGSFCMDAVESSQPCSTVRDVLIAAGHPPGAYVPACQENGKFSPAQFHGSTGYSWCVNVETGQPVSGYYPRGSTPQCLNCSVAGRNYSVGETFPSPDGCNTCFCGSGGVAGCTERACLSPCSLPAETGPCRGAIPAFYYDQESGSCRQFTYGGCGGNANKFASVKDCLLMCAPEDACLETPDPGPCEALFPSFFFNSSSGMCERFTYGGCRGNRNRFSSGSTCVQSCSPDSPVNRCWSVDCPVLHCPEGSEVITDNEQCCPYCSEHCRQGEMPCINGTCIASEYFCDSLTDCLGGYDEFNCQGSCEFQCGDGECIARSRVCDSLLDCSDHSDASNCSQGLDAVVYFQPSAIPRQCPDTGNSPAVCDGTPCRPGECGAGQMCCDNGCGSMSCSDGVPITPVCPAIRRQRVLTGGYLPSCEADGSFSEVQCDRVTDYCWCVDVESGQPVSSGVRGERPVCGHCRRDNGDSVAIGTRFPSLDGCNTCKCTKGFGIICSRRPCLTNSCRVGDRSLSHGSMYRDECSTCECVSGTLQCIRSACSVKDNRMKVNMTFDGDHELVDRNKTDLVREVKRLLVLRYKEGLKLQEEQVRSVELFKGSIVVSVVLEPASNTSGANLTLLLNQLKEDYGNGILVIRYNGLVLEPTGDFQVESDDSSSASHYKGLQWWHIFLIVVGVAIVGVAAVVIVVSCGLGRRASSMLFVSVKGAVIGSRNRTEPPYREAVEDDDDQGNVYFKKNDSSLKFDSPSI